MTLSFEKLAERHKLFRRSILIWAIVLITTMVVWTWLSPPDIPSSTVAALSLVVGILTTVVVLYQYLRSRDDNLFYEERAEVEAAAIKAKAKVKKAEVEAEQYKCSVCGKVDSEKEGV